MPRLLALEPYYGGSHKEWLDGLLERIDWDADVLTLPARKWKWRMRGAAVTMADDVREMWSKGRRWDVIVASTFLNLAEFYGLARTAAAGTPSIVYFHENQMVYPQRVEREWDLHFPLTNVTSALAATRCVFNSEFTRDTFISGIRPLFETFPDHLPANVDGRVREKSLVLPPPLDDTEATGYEPVRGDVCRVVWPHRWEHDKNPEEFFAAIAALAQEGLDFEVAVAGQVFDDRPEVFEHAASVLGDRLVHFGEPRSREEYLRLLASSDVAVSTADNEFFGLAMMEAAYLGCYPVVPDRLVYPELYPAQMRFDSVEQLTARLRSLIVDRPEPGAARPLAEKYTWSKMASRYRDLLEQTLGEGGGDVSDGE